MDEFEFLRQLGTRIGAEADPKIDVAARVIERIGQRRARLLEPRVALVSTCACALSVFAIVAAWSVRPSTTDSMASLSDAAFMNTGPDALLRVLEP